jgi:hypothetical protein
LKQTGGGVRICRRHSAPSCSRVKSRKRAISASTCSGDGRAIDQPAAFELARGSGVRRAVALSSQASASPAGYTQQCSLRERRPVLSAEEKKIPALTTAAETCKSRSLPDPVAGCTIAALKEMAAGTPSLAHAPRRSSASGLSSASENATCVKLRCSPRLATSVSARCQGRNRTHRIVSSCCSRLQNGIN